MERGEQCALQKVDGLTGSSLSFRYDIYQDTTQDMSQELWGVNLLPKVESLGAKKIEDVMKDLFATARYSLWMSCMLPTDMNLPVVSHPPLQTLQAFVIGDGFPPLLLTVYTEEKIPNGLESYVMETARMLHWSLLNFCCIDFVVVPCTLPTDKLTVQSLREEIDKQTRETTRVFHSPVCLEDDTYLKLREAIITLVRSTFVHSLLVGKDEEKVYVKLMNRRQQDTIRDLAESLQTGDQVTVQADDNDTHVAVIEFGKRLGLRDHVIFVTAQNELSHSLGQLIQLSRKHGERRPRITVLETTPRDWDASCLFQLTEAKQSAIGDSSVQPTVKIPERIWTIKKRSPGKQFEKEEPLPGRMRVTAEHLHQETETVSAGMGLGKYADLAGDPVFLETIKRIILRVFLIERNKNLLSPDLSVENKPNWSEILSGAQLPSPSSSMMTKSAHGVRHGRYTTLAGDPVFLETIKRFILITFLHDYHTQLITPDKTEKKEAVFASGHHSPSSGASASCLSEIMTESPSGVRHGKYTNLASDPVFLETIKRIVLMTFLHDYRMQLITPDKTEKKEAVFASGHHSPSSGASASCLSEGPFHQNISNSNGSRGTTKRNWKAELTSNTAAHSPAAKKPKDGRRLQVVTRSQTRLAARH